MAERWLTAGRLTICRPVRQRDALALGTAGDGVGFMAAGDPVSTTSRHAVIQ
jgi:hypothetical protein